MKPKGFFLLFATVLFLFPPFPLANVRIVVSQQTSRDKWVTIQRRGKLIVGVKDNLPPWLLEMPMGILWVLRLTLPVV